ncbi:peptidylprolyl isomerase, partial [Enterococcus faecium]
MELGGLPELDGRITVFGQVYQGLEIVAAIAAQPTN